MAVVEDILQTRLKLVGVGEWTSAWNTAGTASRLFSRTQDEAADSTTRLAAKALLATSAAGALAGALARSAQEAGKMQRLGTAFETVTGGAANANAEISELKKSTASKLFGDETVIRGAIGLRNMGASARETAGWIETLGNVTAGSAGGQEGFASSLNVVSRAIEEQRLSGRELMQMQRQGIPIQEILAKKLGVSAQAIHSLDFEGASAVRALRLLQEGLNERYGGAMARDLGTVDGALDALGNTAQRSGAILGGPLMGAGAAVARMATDMLTAFNNAPQPLKDTASAAGVILVGALGAVGKGLSVAAFDAAKLAKETAQLANAHLKAAEAARIQAEAESALGATMTRGAAGRGRGGATPLNVALPFAPGRTGGAIPLVEEEAAASAGVAAKAGFTGRFGMPAAFGGLIAADLALNMVPDEGGGGQFKRIGNRALEGAGLGLMAGPWGALAGGVLGAGLGGIEEAYRKPEPGAGSQAEILAELKRANDINEKQLNTMEMLRQGGPFDPAILPGALQTQVLNSAYGR